MIAHLYTRLQNRSRRLRRPTLLHRVALPAVDHIAAMMQNLCGNRCRSGFGILMYHRVAEKIAGVDDPTYNVTPEQLRRQLSGLLARSFECWPLARLIEARRRSHAIPSNAFAITFDDGYENVYLKAWPILRELNLPATIFLATKYLDTQRPFPFDDWPATGSNRVPPSAWRPLSIGQCQEMLKDGLIAFGAHTHSHQQFVGRRDEFLADMRLCLGVLRDRLGIEHPPFAFPFGKKDGELLEAARSLDISCSLSTTERQILLGDDEFEWGRFCAENTHSPNILAAKLSGWHSAIISAGLSWTSVWSRRSGAVIHPQSRSTVQVEPSGLLVGREEACCHEP